MKANSLYTPTLSKKDTLHAISLIHNNIEKYFNLKHSPLFVELPSFYNKDSELLIHNIAETRTIAFDHGQHFKVGVLPLFFSNWRRQMIKLMDLKAGDCIKTEGLSIWRDEDGTSSSSTPSSSSTHDEISYVLMVDKKHDIKKILDEILVEVQTLINTIASEIEIMFGVKNILRKKWATIHSQTLQTEMPHLIPKHREEEVLKSCNNFVLKNPGMKTIQGTIHSYRSPQVYDLSQQNVLIIKDRINYSTINVAEVSLFANGEILKDQLEMYSLNTELDLEFYKEMIKETKVHQIEIKIHKSKLYMALLGKGHIEEVQFHKQNLTKKSKKN